MVDATKAVDEAMADAASVSSTAPTLQTQTNPRHPGMDDAERAISEKTHPSPQESAEKAVTAVDWTGPDDPDNPENWSGGKKAFHVIYVGLQCFVTYVIVNFRGAIARS